ncbi:MAG: thiosulfate oxidation carrier protein SoxY [Methyloligellaceae bacterium]
MAVIDRRDFVLGASAAGLISALSIGTAYAEAVPTLEEAMKTAVGDAKPAEGKVTLKLPEIAENGNTVPFSVSVESPMTKDDYVKAVYIFAKGNPRPDVASFMFTPASGEATVTSRMRLGQTQDVVALAEMSNGKVYMGSRTVKVTIGGCGG